MRRDPFAAVPRQTAPNALEYFTNRENFLDAFARHRDTPLGEDLSVLVFYGVGGIGKTTLIRRLCADLGASSPVLPFARFNLENISEQALAYRDVLTRLRSDFENDFRIKFPRFDLALAVLLAQEGGEQTPLVQISPGLQSVFGAALELTPDILRAGMKLAGQQLRSAMSRSAALEQWVRYVGGTDAVLALNEQFAGDDQSVQEELLRRFAQDLSSALPARPGRACRGVLFLDTYEALWTGRESSRAAQSRQLDAWVRTLAEYLLGAGVLPVIAGRDRLGWGDTDPDWDACLDQHLLGGVSALDAQTFLARRGIGAAPPAAPDALQAAILRGANTAVGAEAAPACHLLALALSADIVDNTRQAGGEPDPSLFRAVAPAKMAETLATRFLKSLHNRNLELWVEALSLTPRFDEAAALALDTERQLHAGRAGWEQLQHYSFISAQPDGFYRIHRTMREVLRRRTPEATRQVLDTWYEGYWQGREQTALAFYHRWSLRPGPVLADWGAAHAAAVEALRMGEARALLTHWNEVGLDDDDRHLLTDPVWAQTHLVLGEALQKTSLSPHEARLHRAASHCRAALSVWTETQFPEKWALAQHTLGAVLENLTGGNRTETLHQAAACYEAAMRVRTEDTHPLLWAATITRLGITHAYLPTGDRGHNLRRATECFEASLRVFTQKDMPQKWAKTRSNIGCNYILMPSGDPDENLRNAAACFEAALEVQTETVDPYGWARNQHNLGIVYSQLQAGDQSENLRRAVAHFECALRVNTEEDQPQDWAESQNSLGYTHRAIALMKTSDAERAEMLGRAIDYFQAAQRVWTQSDNAERWGQAEMNQGIAYTQMPGPDRPAILRQALACFQAALEIHTETQFPSDWAQVQEGLGKVYLALAAETGDAGAREEARTYFEAARRGFLSVGHTAEAAAVGTLLAAPAR